MGSSRWLRGTAWVALAAATAAVPISASETFTYTYDALGRLVKAQSSGSINNNHTRSLCYDTAGNRTHYRSSTSGAVAGCAGGTPTPSPTPTPTPGNSPPVTQADSTPVICHGSTTKNLTSNDSDPEGHLPLVLTGITVNSGGASASVISASSIEVYGASASGTSTATYTVRDSLGATSTGSVTIQTTGTPTYCANP